MALMAPDLKWGNLGAVDFDADSGELDVVSTNVVQVNEHRAPSCSSVTGPAGRRKDAARRLAPVACGAPGAAPPDRSSVMPGRDGGTVPSVELRNAGWHRRLAGGWWARAACGRAVL